mmetsp:Transcript_55925/g.121023  ORF Transcript_55925/g.121023 Transcript_55925/m.121023 type:complete len:236 (-) Transcript_55925:207-914(-)|eukprot:CAMPEP_0170592264 /NCGR_PEP_ID=MMETSP0224-20130122/12835_1 /TAXON_ID=285029 /ORGANISM="Togula jolla, Strain CCCM 725" /LENGTH=235 /DNA_ID=CAMNT_0010916165 /DNA_START=72 /DNA_END=779 /DNA_ORIENTATION=-
MAARRAPRVLSAVAAAVVVALLASASFVPAVHSPNVMPSRTTGVIATGTAAAAALSAVQPAFAEEEGFLNFGKIELGGGFAINLDIPETGVINIVVLIGGLLYLLAPLLSESMASREKEIQTDIDDAIAKFNEANARLAEAEKNKAQADQVIAEINASIAKDQKDFEVSLEANAKKTLARQEAVNELLLKELKESSQAKVDSYIESQAVTRGVKELTNMAGPDLTKFLNKAIETI